MFNNVALDWTFMVALSNLNKSFNGSKGKPTGNLVFLPQKDRLPADFRKKKLGLLDGAATGLMRGGPSG